MNSLYKAVLRWLSHLQHDLQSKGEAVQLYPAEGAKALLAHFRCILRVMVALPGLQWSLLPRVAEHALGTMLLLCCKNRNVMLGSVKKMLPKRLPVLITGLLLSCCLPWSRSWGVLQTQGLCKSVLWLQGMTVCLWKGDLESVRFGGNELFIGLW